MARLFVGATSSVLATTSAASKAALERNMMAHSSALIPRESCSPATLDPAYASQMSAPQ